MTISQNTELPAVNVADETRLVRNRRNLAALRTYAAHSCDNTLAPISLFQPLPPWAWVVAGVLAFWGFFTTNPALTVASAVTTLIVASLLWLRAESPVLLFSCAIQWLQVTTPVFYSNVNKIPVSEMYRVTQTGQATWLSLIGIIVLALGIRISWIGFFRGDEANIEAEVRGLDQRRVFVAWIASLGIATLANFVAWRIPGLNQQIYAITTVKWVTFFLLAYGVFVRHQGYSLMFIAVLIEFFAGFTGYFAGFTSVLFMLVLAALCAWVRLRSRNLILLAATVVVILFASNVWTAIKMRYRSFLNQGTGQQTVSVPVAARFEKLQELILDLSVADLSRSVETLVSRVAYTEFFAHTLANVPDVVPFENGKLWSGAITHVLQPRLFFPNKATLDDSARLRIYTGLRVAGLQEGTSIGIGYMGESYIDFGLFGMFIPICLLGIVYGFVYRYFVVNNRSRLLGVANATAVLFLAWQAFATSNVKIFGGLVTQSVVMVLLNLIFGVRLMNWLKNCHPSRTQFTSSDLKL